MAELQKRQGLSREIGYRPHVRFTYFVGWIITLAALFPITKSLLSPGFFRQPTGFIMAFIGFNILAFCAFGTALIFMHRLAFKKMKVQPDKLDVISGGKISQTLEYHNIESIRFDHIPLLLGMFTLVMKDKTEHIFTMAIERSEYILDAIYNAKPDIFDVEKLKDYRLNSVVMDHAAHRLEKRARNWQRFILKFLLYPALLSAGYFGLHKYRGHTFAFTDFLEGWAYSIWAHILLGVLIYCVYDSIIVRREKEKMRKNPNDLRVDMEKEKVIEQETQLFFYICSNILFLIYLFVSL